MDTTRRAALKAIAGAGVALTAVGAESVVEAAVTNPPDSRKEFPACISSDGKSVRKSPDDVQLFRFEQAIFPFPKTPGEVGHATIGQGGGLRTKEWRFATITLSQWTLRYAGADSRSVLVERVTPFLTVERDREGAFLVPNCQAVIRDEDEGREWTGDVVAIVHYYK